MIENMQILSNGADLIVCMKNQNDKEDYLIYKYINYHMTEFSPHINNNLECIFSLKGKQSILPRHQEISAELNIIAERIQIEQTSLPPDIFDKYTISELFDVINKKINKRNNGKNKQK